METLYVYRHSLTEKSDGRGQVRTCREQAYSSREPSGASLGPIAGVVTSDSPRATESALGIGYAVDDTVSMGTGYLAGIVETHDQWRWREPYVAYARLLAAAVGFSG